MKINGSNNGEVPQLRWHLHGHYNEHCDDKIKELSLLVFDRLAKYLQLRGHSIYFSRRERKNGPHPAGSWDIYVNNAAVGDAAIWMSLNRPLNVPIFFHPVLAEGSHQPTAAQEFDAHTRGALVFGMPTTHGGESINWDKEQIDWNWVQARWGSGH